MTPERTVSGKVLFIRESLPLDAIVVNIRSVKLIAYFSVAIFMGGLLVIGVSQVASVVPGIRGEARVYLEALVIILATLFLVSVLAMTMGDRKKTVITDTGILYGGVFQRWEDIRYYVMRKTRRGLFVCIGAKRHMRMYFRGRDSETIQGLFYDLCSGERRLQDNTG